MKTPSGLQMTQNLNKFLKSHEQQDYAVQSGTAMHAQMQNIVVDKTVEHGNKNIIDIIKTRPDLQYFFISSAQTEAPIAGIIHGRFVSRRIDRLIINHDTKTIDFIDYKTDTDKTAFVEKYHAQITEYAELLHSAYPNYKINGYILWLHDWQLDKITH